MSAECKRTFATHQLSSQFDPSASFSRSTPMFQSRLPAACLIRSRWMVSVSPLLTS